MLSKREVNRAGFIVTDPSNPDLTSALNTVNEWRSLHRLPLERLFNDLSACFGQSDFLIAGRIKKLDTIIDKLSRTHTPSKLATIYDIAGCRLVTNSLEEVREVSARLRSIPSCNVDKSMRRDYLTYPKESGYRGVHLIFEYPCPEGYKLSAELQIRTKLQHAWATSVEVYDLAFPDLRLKFNRLDTPQARYFQVASRIIEQVELGTSQSNIKNLMEDLKAIDSQHSITENLEALKDSFSVIGCNIVKSPYCLMELNIAEQSLSLSSVGSISEFIELEQASGSQNNLVLIKEIPLADIQAAYPNYFGDPSVFTDFITSL